MMRREFYPHPTAPVELKQTHISYVFIAGEWVYKLKKPVHFDFLDCSSLDRRFHFCQEEVRLNARMSSGIYDGVYAIMATAGGGFELGVRADRVIAGAVEYAVRMRRLPDDRMLNAIVAAGSTDAQLIRRIAARIAAFHSSAPAADGGAMSVWNLIIGNLAECDTFAGDTIPPGDLSVLDEFCRGFILAHWDTIDDRARRGRVREGHGDLRCEHVCVRGETIDVIDCVEFSQRLRTVDVASDIAFLAMDLDQLGARDLLDEFVSEYAAIAGDDDLYSVLPLYKCYRAVVRGKVESLRAHEPEVDAPGRERSLNRARSYFSLALNYARDAAPALLVVCGKSGTGKSTVARMVRRRTGFEIVSSDVTRKRLANVPADVHAGTGYREGIYSDDFTRRTYAAILDAADRTISGGRGAILDATFKEPDDRRRALEVAARHGAPVLFVECTADEGVIIQRIARRTTIPGGVSDATPEIHRLQRAEFVAMTELPPLNHIVVDTMRPAAEILSQIGRAIALLPHAPAGDPRNYSVDLILRDGGSIRIRAIRPDDKQLLLDHFHTLSHESVYLRFMGFRRDLTPDDLKYLTELDFKNHVGLAATASGPGGERFIGIGRYVRGANPRRAEVAFAVLDDHQGRGIATLLLEHLDRIAHAAGIAEFEADVMGGNRRMLEVFAHCGFKEGQSPEVGVVRVHRPTGEL